MTDQNTDKLITEADFFIRQSQIISKRLKSVEMLLRSLADDPQTDAEIINQRSNKFDMLNISTFWEPCSSPQCAVNNCEVCCESVLKMFIETNLLNKQSNVVESYTAVWRIISNIICGMRQKEHMALQRARVAAAKQREEADFPEDLKDLYNDWNNRPEKKAGVHLPVVSDNLVQTMVADLNSDDYLQTKLADLEIENNTALPQTTTVKRLLAMQQKDRALIFNRPIRVVKPQQVKLTPQGLMSALTGNQLRVLPVRLTPQRSILQNRTNQPTTVPGYSLLGRPRVGRPPLMTSQAAANRVITFRRALPPRQVQQTQPNVTFIQPMPKTRENDENDCSKQ
ncbi:uncharacterized protein LOC111058140 isoform X1 [Nilaparvata lugens]|uniref:uncharacterized protein LOC111058140 isoform X1 n=1 Tax=Nilaparvata lugens TaxID=108931 RepID=UPI00193D8440|nr:uncharacterized protein LOC111058140 isoform X1 [Nilaparvata lugens]